MRASPTLLNYGDDPVIKRADKNDCAGNLIREEAVAFKLGHITIEKATARPSRSEPGFPKDSEGASLTH